MNTVNADRRYFPRGPGLGLRTLALAACAIGLLFTDQRSTSLNFVRDGATWMLTPILWVAALPHQAVDAAGGVKSRDALERENATLKQRELLLDVRLQKFEALEAENRRIRELLASARNLKDRVLIAEIIAVSQDPYRHQITLNKGSDDKVYRGQALVDAFGILGQVVEVGPNTSQALLLTDPDHGIPVEINRTGLQTIALGRGDGQGLKLPFLPSNADVQVGDLLVSSALGGRFPAGYPVGQIYDVKHNAGEHFMEAAAYPSAKLNQGRQALLVWSEHGTEAPATAEPAPLDAATTTTTTPAAPELASESKAATKTPTTNAKPAPAPATLPAPLAPATAAPAAAPHTP